MSDPHFALTLENLDQFIVHGPESDLLCVLELDRPIDSVDISQQVPAASLIHKVYGSFIDGHRIKRAQDPYIINDHRFIQRHAVTILRHANDKVQAGDITV